MVLMAYTHFCLANVMNHVGADIILMKQIVGIVFMKIRISGTMMMGLVAALLPPALPLARLE